MKKEDILREELVRMRQLMGMNGSLYQKPIMEDESKHHGDEQPNPADYKGGEANPEYRNALRHWEREHQRPPSPPPPPPSPPAPSPQKGPASTDDKKSPRKLKTKGMSGEYFLPFNSIPGIKGRKGKMEKKGKGKKKKEK